MYTCLYIRIRVALIFNFFENLTHNPLSCSNFQKTNLCKFLVKSTLIDTEISNILPGKRFFKVKYFCLLYNFLLKKSSDLFLILES